MSDPRVFWLIVTNAVLGVVIVALVVTIATGVLCDAVARFRKRRDVSNELDRDMDQYFGHSRR